MKPRVGGPDPFELVAGELAGLSDGIRSLIGTDHPVLNAAAKYFFELDGGKKIRPTMVTNTARLCKLLGALCCLRWAECISSTRGLQSVFY